MVHTDVEIVSSRNFKFTDEELQRAYQNRDLMRVLKQRYPDTDYRARSKKFGIRFYETNKIRKLLARYYNTGGYPVKFYNHVSYFSGIAMWIPDQWVILPKWTKQTWSKNYREKDSKFGIWDKELLPGLSSMAWRYVVIQKMDLYDDPTNEAVIKGAKDIGLDILSLLTFSGASGGSNLEKLAHSGDPDMHGGMFSSAVDNVWGNIESAMSNATRWSTRIYPRLLFYNTINDEIIWANWNLVLADLNKIEEEKYLSPIEQVSKPLFPMG